MVVVYDVMVVPVMVMLPHMMVRWCVLVLGMLVRMLSVGMVVLRVLGMLVRMRLVGVHWVWLMRRLDRVLLQLMGMGVRMRMLLQMTVGGCRDNWLGLRSLSLPVAFTPLGPFLVFSAPYVPNTPIHASTRLGAPRRKSGSHVRAKLPFPVPVSQHLPLALCRQFPVTWGEFAFPHFTFSLDQLPFSVPLELTFSLYEARGSLDSCSSRSDEWGARRAARANYDTRTTYSRTKRISRWTCSNRRGSLKYAHRWLRERWPVSIHDARPCYGYGACNGVQCIL